MSEIADKLQRATGKIKSRKIVLYHVFSQINDAEFNQIKQSGVIGVSKSALGGQSNGAYFFTTRIGATNHIKEMQGIWENTNNKNAYLAETEVDLSDAHYPTWKLDYEAMQDFLFDMIYDAARQSEIKFSGIKVSATNNNILTVTNNGVYSRLSGFVPEKHSGLVEKIADYLYSHNVGFKQQYDKLLTDVFLGYGDNQELFAVKTSMPQMITKITKIEKEPAVDTISNSQINKFLSRYGKRRN